MQAGDAFLYHLSEGTDPKLEGEHRLIQDHDCLQPTFGAIHCTALTATEFQQWAPHGSSIVWSTFSNLWLYRATTDVLGARAAGLRVCVGADRSPSGSQFAR